jgi:tRNA(fMet)-specific endonuclease VapC
MNWPARLSLAQADRLARLARYLVDTTVLIDLSRGLPGTRAQLDALLDAGAVLGICAVNIAEFIAGIPTHNAPLWDHWLSEFEYWEISREAAWRAGNYRYLSARDGRVLQLPDALIAAVATTFDATVLTDNVKDFQLVEEVRAQALRS